MLRAQRKTQQKKSKLRVEVWSSNAEGGLVPGESGGLEEGLLIALIAARKGVHLTVVEKGFGAISPGETLQENKLR